MSPKKRHFRDGVAWQVGDTVKAQISKSFVEQAQIVRDNRGRYYGNMLLGFTPEIKMAYCYHIETVCSKLRMWVPEDGLSLTERSRPYYGPTIKAKENKPRVRRPRKERQDHPVPLTVAQPNCSTNPDPNTTYFTQALPKVNVKDNNAYKEFIRRCKDKIYLQLDKEIKDNQRAEPNHKHKDTPNHIELLPKEKEIDAYLAQCWRYNQTFRTKMTTTTYDSEGSNDTDDEPNSDDELPVSNYTGWCIVCGLSKNLVQCTTCPASYHKACRKDWPSKINHRMNLTTQLRQVGQDLRSGKIAPSKGPLIQCPNCAVGPTISYGDIIWHKLGLWQWWPARIMEPGSLPSCLLAKMRHHRDWPLAYYGEDRNFSWSDRSRMCMFLPHHNPSVHVPCSNNIHLAMESASSDYIVNYLK